MLQTIPCKACVHICLLCIIFTIFTILIPSISCEYQDHDSGTQLEGFCESSKEDCSGPSSKDLIQQHMDRLNYEVIKDWIYIAISFKNAEHNTNLQDKFRLTVSSLLYKSTKSILFFIIGDEESQKIAADILSTEFANLDIKISYELVDIDAEKMALELHEVVKPFQKVLGAKPKTYYSDSLFFLSIAIHRIMPDSMNKMIMLDADLKFLSDIHQLFKLFDDFKGDNIIGIARENQPVYRHAFSFYRSSNKGTRVGEPPPDGLTGFNSGVLLLNLESMRSSRIYNSLVNEEKLVQLCEKYHFKGHLGDQDFFTLISIDHEQLFYILPCGWNRQLCTWWRDHGYREIFEQYYKCTESVHILHGNCNTKIPETI